MLKISMFRKKEIIMPTLLGWLLIGTMFTIFGLLIVKTAHPFLAYHQPISGQALIVEGWIPDYALETTYKEFRKGGYEFVLTTGGPLERGSYLTEFQSFAELASMSLKQMGIKDSVLIPLPSSLVQKGRTQASTLVVKKWLAKHPDIQRLNLITLGTHSRRSYYSFRESLPSNIELGVISVASQDYPAEKWWRYSAGVRAVIYESIAYFYVYLF